MIEPHDLEADGLAECVDCGAEIDERAEPSFAFGPRGVLCLQCAMRRGGEYDAVRDRWTKPPNLEGLESAALEA